MLKQNICEIHIRSCNNKYVKEINVYVHREKECIKMVFVTTYLAYGTHSSNAWQNNKYFFILFWFNDKRILSGTLNISYIIKKTNKVVACIWGERESERKSDKTSFNDKHEIAIQN